MTNKIRYDRVYFYVGGLERGEWRETQPHENETVAGLVASIERQGYVAVRGSSIIGPPVGPPSRERFADVLSMGLPPMLAAKTRAQILGVSHD